MIKNWEIKKFSECLQKVSSTTKIHKKKFLSEGSYPIISQETSLVNGYWDNKDDLFIVDKPIVVFGDHTKVIKYVDFSFVRGADGVKILLPISQINSKFFSYQLQSIKLRDLGYARHFRLLKEKTIQIPPIEQQKEIVEILDQAFESIDKAKTNIERNIKNAKELLVSQREIFFDKLSFDKSSQIKPLNDLCLKIFAGGDKPKDFSKTKTLKQNIPVIANAVKNNGIYGYTEIPVVKGNSVTVAARGSGTGHVEFRDYDYFPVVRLIVLIPENDLINEKFLMTALKNLKVRSSGSAIPQLTVPMIKTYSIPVPDLEKQKEIVETLDIIDNHIQSVLLAYDEELKNLEELKKSILQKAFSGELTNKNKAA